jgi:hypothetical protein
MKQLLFDWLGGFGAALGFGFGTGLCRWLVPSAA